ncbi:hypothetical protein ANN_00863 [Periplaneta americana]|uniref:Long-chain-fatty-acid--CoA ligase n=1 Tax=Periplaneta americana TaxID=6978 RepID=A0ABQ8TV69_PERAM|nr:hypothetical protein ANN_00863 [Periplaneta americana]
MRRFRKTKALRGLTRVNYIRFVRLTAVSVFMHHPQSLLDHSVISNFSACFVELVATINFLFCLSYDVVYYVWIVPVFLCYVFDCVHFFIVVLLAHGEYLEVCQEVKGKKITDKYIGKNSVFDMFSQKSSQGLDSASWYRYQVVYLYLLITMAVKYLLALTPDDVMYNPLPMYHSAGGIIGTGPALVHGNPIVLRTKFSASSYWTDCIKYKCTIRLHATVAAEATLTCARTFNQKQKRKVTIAQYIGEMCRYIMAVPRKPEDTRHHIRLMVGNGMRSTIWKDFVERFKIEQVTELYASTEGNVNICEPGMFVGLISSSNAIRDYHGYVDKKASSKKVLHDVFGKGDKAFLSGDILVMDKYGYLYFKDRTGDTFRWKGENVATAEVESVIINVIGLKDAAVYGVQVPDQEGRAGMAAIADPNKSLDFKNLAEYLDKTLPSYARPIFIRVLEEMDMTGTFKIKKNELQEDGFDPIRIKDKIYFRSGKDYVPLTSQLYQDILKGIVRI